MPNCLYCKRSDGPFTSQEHVIPESLGNKGLGGKKPIILPRGVVCDPCNNGPLSRLDQVLIDFEMVSMMKTFYGITSKSGKLPHTTFGNNIALRMFAPGHVVIESNNKRAVINKGSGEFNLKFRSKRPVDAVVRRELTKALYKMTLGCMYIDESEVAMSERFDPLRRRILGQEDFHGFVTVVFRAWEPTAEDWHSGMHYGFLDAPGVEPTVWTRFDFIKISLFTDLEAMKLKKPMLYPGDKAEILEF
jgi:hypothetical protein